MEYVSSGHGISYAVTVLFLEFYTVTEIWRRGNLEVIVATRRESTERRNVTSHNFFTSPELYRKNHF